MIAILGALFGRRKHYRSVAEIEADWQRDLAEVERLRGDETLSTKERLDAMSRTLLAGTSYWCNHCNGICCCGERGRRIRAGEL